MRNYVAIVCLSVGVVGCGVLPGVEITGDLDISGDVPAAFNFEVYSALTNTSAFDLSYCNEVETDGQCYGRVQMDNLGEPVSTGEAVVDGSSFVLPEVPADVGYMLIVSSADPDVICNTDIVGVDGDDKVVTSTSAIKLELSGGLRTFELPRSVRLDCSAASDTPDVPDQEPPQEPDNGEDIQPPAEVEWTAFSLTGKGGSPVYADASVDSVVADLPCDDSFPSVLEVNGELAGAESAWIRIQFGSGADAQYRTIETEVVDGVVQQAVSLTGGYAVLQLDTNEALDGVGESQTITVCEPSDAPVQEFLLVLSWDKNDTDVDAHVHARGQEVAYYNMRTSWGELDIDDIDGFGPETVTSDPSVADERYDVRIHYYSDHGNGPTTATTRVIYADPEGEVCDVTVSKRLTHDEWWNVGVFAPGLCPGE
ncbi:MAG TPA: hypothetical protein ENK18_22755 [Deltaproteobacteria bacterium]|nr:hypothetical protein [Deltaproteobacteria bacterium]